LTRVPTCPAAAAEDGLVVGHPGIVRNAFPDCLVLVRVAPRPTLGSLDQRLFSRDDRRVNVTPPTNWRLDRKGGTMRFRHIKGSTGGDRRSRARPTVCVVGATLLASLLSASSAPAASMIHLPPGTQGTATYQFVPSAPGLRPLEPTASAVTIRWSDHSNNEQKFVLSKRDGTGRWLVIYQVPTRDGPGTGGDDYVFIDSDRSVSGQCYKVAAVNQNGEADTRETCTVRPDPSRFPQSVPSKVKQWYGLSNRNDGTSSLRSGVRSFEDRLTWGHQTYGVDLDWSDRSLWKIEARGGPHLMYGQAVALRVWGGGWLTYGQQTWGVDLQLSSRPSYQWYVVGGTPGTPIDNEEFALWNSATDDYLIASHQTWGVNLDWYQKTLPPPPPPPPPPPRGVKTFIANNCIIEQRPLEIWVADLTAGTGYMDTARLDSQYAAGGGCPFVGAPWTFTPKPGHQYLVRSVDYTAPGCTNDPMIGSCWRSQTTFTGDANGVVTSLTIG